MGIHTGEASQTVTGLVGLDVHRAARVAAVGYGGQVLLSETAAALVRDSPSGRRGAQGSRCPPAEGPRAPGTHLPAPGPGPAGGVSPVALARQPGAAKQPPGPALDVHRARPGVVRRPR